MNKESVFVGGGVVAAIVSSLCCVLPLVAVVFGISAFGMASAFESFRPYLLVVAFAALAFSFYRVYFRREQCAEGAGCATKPLNKLNQLFLWSASVLIVAFALAPYYTGYLAAAATANRVPAQVNSTLPSAIDNALPARADEPLAAAAAETESAANKTLVIGVRGMTCAGCETHIEEALKKLRGVVSADADYQKYNVTVVYNPGQVTVKQIREAIAATGYELI